MSTKPVPKSTRGELTILTIVVPHGGRKTCHPQDVRKLLEVLGL
jgi:hypothetical protein